MKKFKKIYYYIFYKFYKFSEAAPSHWLSDWKAGVAIIVLEIWGLFSIMNYYNVFIDRYFHFNITNPIIVIPGILVFLINYLSFIHTDVWKEYAKEFDKLPKKKNIIGSWIVFGITLFILANVFFSFYLMSRIDWSQYR